MIDPSAFGPPTRVHGANAKRYAVVHAGVVVDVVMWDPVCCLACSLWRPAMGEAIPCGDEVGAGWRLNADGIFAAPSEA